MPIVSADLNIYGSAVMPADDVTANVGGAIDTAGQVDRLVLAAADTITVASSGAGDGRDVRITGLDAAGAEVVDTITLVGTAPQVGSVTFAADSLKAVEVFAFGTTTRTPTADVVTVTRTTGGANVVTIRAQSDRSLAMFRNSSSDTGGVSLRYEKLWMRNDHGTLTLLSAIAEITQDPQADYRIGLADAGSPNQTVANRTTAPGGVTFFDDGADIALSDMAAGASRELWIEQNLPQDNPAYNSFFSTTLAGTSTA